MELPWETIFGAAGGSAIVTVLGVLLAQKLIEGIVNAAEETHKQQLELASRKVESALARAEETHKQQLELASRKVESALAQAEETHKKQLELAGGIDLDLREKRKNAYSVIWGTMRLLPNWPHAEDVTYERLTELSGNFTKWYFDGGGMYLSASAMKAYISVQDAIKDVVGGKKGGDAQEQAITAVVGEKRSGPIKPEEYDAVRDKCSAFRTALTNDLLSRRSLTSAGSPSVVQDSGQPPAIEGTSRTSSPSWNA